jgi:hypothetical protein
VGETGINKKSAPLGPCPCANNVSYYNSYRIKIYECEITESQAMEFVKRIFGQSKLMYVDELDKPFRVVRYNFQINREQHKQDQKCLLPENENNLSTYHFIHSGYYINCGKVIWAYDKHNGKMYYCFGYHG